MENTIKLNEAKATSRKILKATDLELQIFTKVELLKIDKSEEYTFEEAMISSRINKELKLVSKQFGITQKKFKEATIGLYK